MAHEREPKIFYDSKTDFYDGKVYDVPAVIDPGPRLGAYEMLPSEVVLAAWLTRKAKETGQGKFRAYPGTIGKFKTGSGVSILTFEGYQWDAPAPPLSEYCMADLDFQAASGFVRPAPRSRLLLAARLLPDRGMFRRTQKSTIAINCVALSQDEPCKITIVADAHVDRIWVGWTADFLKALPSRSDVQARSDMTKTAFHKLFKAINKLSNAKDFPPTLIPTDAEAEDSCCYTTEERQFMSAHEVKDWNELHQRLQEMSQESSRSYSDRYILGSAVQEMLWKEGSKKDWVPKSEWRSVYNDMVGQVCADSDDDENDPTDKASLLAKGRRRAKGGKKTDTTGKAAKASTAKVKKARTKASASSKPTSSRLSTTRPRRAAAKIATRKGKLGKIRNSSASSNDLTEEDEANWSDVEDADDEDADFSAMDLSDDD